MIVPAWRVLVKVQVQASPSSTGMVSPVEVPLPVIVLGGVYSGVFAVSEAAAVTAVYVFVVEVLIYREIPIRRLPSIMRESMMMVGGILIILGASLASRCFNMTTAPLLSIGRLPEPHWGE